MVATSYLDFLVAQRVRAGQRSRKAGTEPLSAPGSLSMPWGLEQWIGFGVVAFVLAFMSGLTDLGGFVLINLAAAAIGGVLLATNWRRLQQLSPEPVSQAGASLQCLNGEHAGTVWQLSQAGASIGRSQENDIILAARSVSRRHAALVYAQGGWFIQDRDSAGGTFVNGQRVPAVRLTSGDEITIGDTVFGFYVSQ